MKDRALEFLGKKLGGLDDVIVLSVEEIAKNYFSIEFKEYEDDKYISIYDVEYKKGRFHMRGESVRTEE